MKFSKQLSTVVYPIVLKLLRGNEMLKSWKLSKAKLEWAHSECWQEILFNNWPSNKSVIMLSSLSKLYFHHLLLYVIGGSLAKSISLYFGLCLTLFSSSCNPSKKNLRNSCASCCPYPLNWGLSFEMALLIESGLAQVVPDLISYRSDS